MLVYRPQERDLDTRAELARLRSVADPAELLIDAGVLEAAVCDAIFPERDGDTETSRALRDACIAAARGSKIGLDRLAALPLPAIARAGIPEGYAYYAVYPEMYAEAARRYAGERRPARAAVVGIRNIGASLSAAVAAALQGAGCDVRSWTARPRGHPFDRRLCLEPELAAGWRASTETDFLIVDEGPGLSGSSFASVARALAELGVPDERIIFFPSWNPDGACFISASAREIWPQHVRYTVDFEDVFPPGSARDLSAGRWRSLFYGTENDRPAVQPQHERRKYLTAANRLRKFGGLGRCGRAKLARAERLAAAGFSAPPVALLNGFLETRFIPGRPLRAPDDIAEPLLARIAGYLAFLAREFPASREVGLDGLAEVIRVNAGFEPPPIDFEPACAVALDGRMLPHEWILTAAGYLKTDALDHHDDHFYPGPQDIAWDLAGSAVELQLTPAQERFLVSRYERLTGDRLAPARLAFHRLAYLAFRFGYATLAQTAIAGTPDAARFRALAARYELALKAARPCR